MLKRILLFSQMVVGLVFALMDSAAAYESLAYLYGGSTSTYLKLVDRSNSGVSTVCPDYFEVAVNGELKYTKNVDKLLLSSMADKGIKATPFLSNHWSRENARAMLSKRELVTTQLAQAVENHGLDGLDIDIQNILETDKDAFTDFIRLLRLKMPEYATLTVCVPANPYYTTTGWQGGYDYAALAKYCDHIFIMTYDEAYYGGTPGAVASYGFVENSIRYGLQYVPKEKLMVGLALYGRYWSSTVKGGAFTGADIEWLVNNTDSTTWYDDSKECARATVNIPVGTTITTWGGRVISGGTYDIWYDNSRSYEKKLALVRKYDLKGVGMWALGQEPAAFWADYPAWLAGYPFSDISNHWAQGYIISLSEMNIIQGDPEGRFLPEGNLTRAQAAALLVRLAGLSTDGRQHPFTDIKGLWCEMEIAAAYETQLVFGDGEGRFLPDQPITREEFALMSERYTNLDESFDLTEELYPDISYNANPESFIAIAKLSAHGVLGGFPGGEFRPKNLITRAQAAKVIMLLGQLPTRFLGNEILPLKKAYLEPR